MAQLHCEPARWARKSLRPEPGERGSVEPRGPSSPEIRHLIEEFIQRNKLVSELSIGAKKPLSLLARR